MRGSLAPSRKFPGRRQHRTLISSETRTRSRAGSSLEDPKRHLRRYPSRECFLMSSINSSKEPTTCPLPWGLFLLV